MDARLARLARHTTLAFPGATALHLEPIPEKSVGYMLNDVTLADGSLLSDTGRGPFAVFADSIHPIASTLPDITDGDRVHVTGYGAVTVTIPPLDRAERTARLVTARMARADRDRDAVANTLAAARELRGLSQAELGGRAGVSREMISFIERGICRPSLLVALQLARALSLPVEEIFSLPGKGVQETSTEAGR